MKLANRCWLARTRWLAAVPKQTERKTYVIHNCGSLDPSVAAWSGERLRDRRVHSPPPGGCRGHGAAPGNSGTTSRLSDAKEDESSHRETIMNKIVSLALLVGGIVLIVTGFNATHSFSSDVSRFFTASPTNKAVWMLMGGIVAVLIGLTMLWRSPNHT
jgi:Protein of unknown function (DUF3185)